MWLLLGGLRRRRVAGGGPSLKHHTAPAGTALFSWRNNKIWCFHILGKHSGAAMSPQREEGEERGGRRGGSYTTLCHYNCRPEENERPSEAAARNHFLSDCSARMAAMAIWDALDCSLSLFLSLSAQGVRQSQQRGRPAIRHRKRNSIIDRISPE